MQINVDKGDAGLKEPSLGFRWVDLAVYRGSTWFSRQLISLNSTFLKFRFAIHATTP